ncbi:MAG TPA: gliding motility protein GldN [Saprospiraceae bacterium]|nr:gliding motility protein GldN [Saprospiraceae bacterium]
MKFNLFYVVALLCPFLSFAQGSPSAPLDDIVERTILQEKPPLSYRPLRETDIVWSKKVWQEIDTRQKQNLTFRSPHAPLYEILEKGITAGEITAYSAEDDQFSEPFTIEEFIHETSSTDTILITDPITLIQSLEVVRDHINYESVFKFRVKEIWYFDGLSATMKVRILGIAPIVKKTTEDGDASFEYPLFWVYYPHCREYLSKFEVYNPSNDMGRMSWENLLEMRKFDSTIIKASNTQDVKLSAAYTGRDLLLEAEKIKTEIRNFEEDMWGH